MPVTRVETNKSLSDDDGICSLMGINEQIGIRMKQKAGFYFFLTKRQDLIKTIGKEAPKNKVTREKIATNHIKK